MAVAITAVDQDAWPVWVLVSVTGLTVGTTVSVYRVVGASRTALRGADAITAADTSLVAVDAELPFGTPVSYTVAVSGVDAASTTPTARTLTGGRVAVTDAIAGAAAEVVVTAWPSRARTRQASTYQCGTRTVVVAGPLGAAESRVELLTETDTATGQLIALAESATSGTVQIRQPGGYGRVDSYLAVTGVEETRVSQDGTDPRRRIVLDVVETEAWPAVYEARGWTLADLDAAYTGLTLADLAGDYGTLLALAQADLGAT